MEPYFSVIIPLYNKANYIENTLRSVLAQSFSDFEIVMVNDGSTDNSLEKVREIHDDRIKLIDQKNQGASIARNHGIERAKGKYIVFLDADDYWYPNHLKVLQQLILKFPKAGLHCNNYEIYRGNGLTVAANFTLENPKKQQILTDYFLGSIADPIVIMGNFAVSKNDFHTIGKFDPLLRTGQDIDFFVRAALKTAIAFNPKITMRYHKQSENNLAQSHYNNDRIYLIEKFEAEEKDNPSLKKYLDVNRYAVALRCKFRNDPAWKKLVSKIDLKNLNPKQRVLLKMPKPLLQLAVKFQQLLMKSGIYLTAFK
ncbi:MAG TPA: glycosyltransferase family 2 protein [Flavobacteriaceae bacterium]|nr:glycosyltransferase family 2 protein [Flavobacteriaceae bacterium]